MVGVMRGIRRMRTGSTWSSTGGRTGRRTLPEDFKGSFIWNLTRRRSWGDHIHTLVGGRLPNLVCFGCKFPGILDILFHQVGVNVRGQVVEEEPPNMKHSVLWILWSTASKLHIKVDGFSSTARVRDIRAWNLWKGLKMWSSMRHSLRDS